MQTRKVRIADIERLKRTMENVPEHQAEEVTTAQAVRMLSSEIHSMQAKGYGLPAIAGVVGVAILAITLLAIHERVATSPTIPFESSIDEAGLGIR